MWDVDFESASVQREVEKLIKAKKLTEEDHAIIHAWIRQVTYHGPDSIQKDSKWADHELHDDWEGYRSSSFSNSGRIIYRVIEKKIAIRIAPITENHDCGQKGKKDEKG